MLVVVVAGGFVHNVPAEEAGSAFNRAYYRPDVFLCGRPVLFLDQVRVEAVAVEEDGHYCVAHTVADGYVVLECLDESFRVPLPLGRAHPDTGAVDAYALAVAKLLAYGGLVAAPSCVTYSVNLAVIRLLLLCRLFSINIDGKNDCQCS